MLRSGKISEQQLEDEKKAWEERGLEKEDEEKKEEPFSQLDYLMQMLEGDAKSDTGSPNDSFLSRPGQSIMVRETRPSE